MTDEEKAFLDAVIKRYHEKEKSAQFNQHFNTVAYEVAKEIDPEGLPKIPNLGDEPGVLKFRNDVLVSRPSLYFLDVNAAMEGYRNGFLLRDDVKAYIEANL